MSEIAKIIMDIWLGAPVGVAALISLFPALYLWVLLSETAKSHIERVFRRKSLSRTLTSIALELAESVKREREARDEAARYEALATRYLAERNAAIWHNCVNLADLFASLDLSEKQPFLTNEQFASPAYSPRWAERVGGSGISL